MRTSGVWALAAWLVAPLCAQAGSPVILVQEKVPQYREAAKAAQAHVPEAVSLDPSDPAVAGRLKDASVILAVGQRSLTLARQAAPAVPVVFCMVLGITKASLSGRVVGVPLEPDPALTFGEIRAVDPAVRRLGVIYDAQVSEVLMAEAQKAAPAAGLTLVPRPVSAATEVQDAMAKLAGSVDALWLPPNPQLISKELFAFLLSFSAERKLPLFGFLDSFTEAGALASVSPDYELIGDRAGTLAAEVLSGGAARRPSVTFAPGGLTVNLRTARALGVDVSPKALAGAKQVYR